MTNKSNNYLEETSRFIDTMAAREQLDQPLQTLKLDSQPLESKFIFLNTLDEDKNTISTVSILNAYFG